MPQTAKEAARATALEQIAATRDLTPHELKEYSKLASDSYTRMLTMKPKK